MSENAEHLRLGGDPVLDLLAPPFMLVGYDIQPAGRNVDLASGDRSDGAVPIGEPWHDALIAKITLRIDEDSDMEAGLAVLSRLTQRVESCHQVAEGMETFVRPRGAESDSTLIARSGRVIGTPQEMSGETVGWWHQSPVVMIELVCDPFYLGDWSTPVVVTAATPLVEVELENVEGEVDAEGEMTITDAASQNRSHLEWGLESYGYDAASPSATLLNLASGLTVSGFAGASSTEAGSYSTNTVEGTALHTPVAVCGTNAQAHYGHKRSKIRCKGSSTDVQFRLVWRLADGPWSYGDPVQVHMANEWLELDLGALQIEKATAGTHRWEGHVQVWSDRLDGTRDTYSVDYLEVLPAERFGKVFAPDFPTGANSIIAIDDFSLISSGMSGDSASSVGGAWTTGGDGADFQASSSIPGFSDSVRRQTLSDAVGTGQFARIGSVVAGSRSVVGLLIQGSIASTAVKCGAMLRYDSATNNCVVAVLRPRNFSGVNITEYDLAIYERVGGTWTLIDSTDPVEIDPSVFIIDFAVGAGGSYEVSVWDYADGPTRTVLSLEGFSPTLASNGTLATGRVGFYDEWPTATAADRSYYLFSAFSNPSPPLVCYSGRSIITAHDRCERYDSTGTFVSTPPRVIGSRLFIPPAGDRGEAVRIVTKLRRVNIDVLPDSNVADSHQVSVRYRPRFRNPLP